LPNSTSKNRNQSKILYFCFILRMKNFVTCLIISCIAFSASAQITISRNDMPAARDTFRFATVQPLGANINVSRTGANTTWNFSNLTPNGDELLEYVSSFQTPYAFFFFNTFGNLVADNIGFGQFALTNVFNFYKTTNSKFTVEGMGFRFNKIPLAGFYSNKDEIYQFPLKYNDKDNSTFKIAVQIPTIGSYRQSGSRENTVDGWGKITTPYKTYDCIRVKSVITQVDSISVSQPFPVSFGFPSTRVEYKWLTKNDKVPVLEVAGIELAGNFVANSIRYRYERKAGGGGGTVGVKEVAANIITVYPNPATDKVIVNMPNYGVDYVKLFSMEGKELTVNHTRTATGIEVNTQNIANGFYMLFAKSGNEMIWEKVQISK